MLRPSNSWTRRALVGALGLLTAVPGLRAAAAAAAAAPWRRLRRVVTTERADGRSVVLFDGPPGNSFELNGTRITRLWEAPHVPASVPFRDDAGQTAGNAYRPGFEGTSFYVAELPGGARAPRIAMHKSASLDYMAVLAGRIVLVTDEREVELAAGDTIVQGGANHTWVNRWPESCLLLFVVIAAHVQTPVEGAPHG